MRNLVSVFGLTLALLALPACESEKDKAASAAKKDQATADALGQRMKQVRAKIADETAKDPNNAMDVATKYEAELKAIEAQVAALPQEQRDYFNKTYRQK